MMKESEVVAHVTGELNRHDRRYINVHGSTFSKNGTADIITLDSDARHMEIEVKAPHKHLKVNQWREAIKVLCAGGRFIVGHHDFNMDKVNNHTLPVQYIGSVIGESDFKAAETTKIKVTTEIKLIDDLIK